MHCTPRGICVQMLEVYMYMAKILIIIPLFILTYWQKVLERLVQNHWHYLGPNEIKFNASMQFSRIRNKRLYILKLH